MTKKPNFAKFTLGAVVLALLFIGTWATVRAPRTSAAKGKTTNKVKNATNGWAITGSEFLSPIAMMPPGNPAGNLDQVRNGSAASPTNPVDWVNGNAGAQTAHYKEGQSIPYRLALTNLPNGTNTVSIEWDIRHSSVEAIDYITSVFRTPPAGISETIHVCGDAQYSTVIAGCTEGSYQAFPIPTPPVSKTAFSGKFEPSDSFAALPGSNAAPDTSTTNAKQLRIYSPGNVATITGATYINNADGNLGDLTASQSSTRLKITFTTNFTGNQPKTVVLAWGGHIASRGDWGFNGSTPDSAGGISGSPYHTRFIELCPAGLACGGGNQDRSLSASAVAPPAQCNLTGPATECQGATGAHYEVDTASLDTSATYTWNIPAATNTSGASITSSNGNPLSPPVYADVSVGNTPGSFTITATAQTAGGTSQPCPFTTTVTANTSATDLANQTKCPGQSASFSTTASGTGPFTYKWLHDNVEITGQTSSSLTIASVSASDAGQYCVQVTGNCGDPVTKCASLTVNSDVSASTTNDEQCVGATAHLTATASGTGVGTGSFTWSKGGTPITTGVNTVDNGNSTFTSTLTLTNVQTGDAGNYNVFVDGTCLDANKTATLTVDTNPTVSIGISNACAASAKLTATAGFSSYSWTGPGILPDDGTCGPTKSCILVNATGVYTVAVTDSHSCNGSQTGQICFSLTTPAPSPTPVVRSIPNQSPDSNATAARSFKTSLVSEMVRIFSGFALAVLI